MTKPKRKPPLTPDKVRTAMDQLQALYGARALPKEPPTPAPPKVPGK